MREIVAAPLTRYGLVVARQPSPSTAPQAKAGGAEGIRTPDLLIANQSLYQLSYDPIHRLRARIALTYNFAPRNSDYADFSASSTSAFSFGPNRSFNASARPEAVILAQDLRKAPMTLSAGFLAASAAS
jgi:hypothetical protein